jgi:hypothetical protein
VRGELGAGGQGGDAHLPELWRAGSACGMAPDNGGAETSASVSTEVASGPGVTVALLQLSQLVGQSSRFPAWRGYGPRWAVTSLIRTRPSCM